MPEEGRLHHLLEARTVAVVGASERAGSVGATTLAGLLDRQFGGRVYPVNPRYRELRGLRCLPSLAEVPERLDLVVIAVGNDQLEKQLKLAAEQGARSAVIFASGFEQSNDGPAPLIGRLATIARDSEMILCGPNCMGFINLAAPLQVCGYTLPSASPGNVSLISHSGSSFSALLHNNRELRFNIAVSSGRELVTTAADYLRYCVELDSTRAVGLLVEQIRDPAAFASAMATAYERDIPVVALKLGSDPRTADLLASHSGAIAGDDGAYEAFFDAHGIHRVRDLTELVDTLELLAAPRRAVRGGLGVVSDSGGERSLLLDLAGSLPLSEPSESTRTALQATLGPELAPVNPVDAFSADADATRVFVDALRLLHDDENTGAIALAVDLTGRSWERYVEVASQAVVTTTKPFAVLVPYPGGMNRASASRMRARGVPVLEGMTSGLAALRHLFDHRDFRDRPEPTPHSHSDPSRIAEWKARLAGEGSPGEATALELLSAWGIPVARTVTVTSEAEAVRVAAEIGWPVALKTAASGVPHKTDERGVFLGLDGVAQVRAAYHACARRLGPAVNIQKMAPPGVELALGIVHDVDFGPLLVVAAGGTQMEILNDRCVALPMLDGRRAMRLLDRLKVRPMLDAFRGRPAIDFDALTEAMINLCGLAGDLSESIDALDINPLVVTPHGCIAVDALVVPSGKP